MVKKQNRKFRTSLSVVISAYNEEKNLKDTVNTTKKAVEKYYDDYELIIVDDKSTDRTGEIADELAKKDPHIRVFHSKKNKGMGFSYKKGIELAKKEYVTRIPGDNEIKGHSIEDLIKCAGDADIVIMYISNPEIRPLYRRFISRSFTIMMNLLFGLNLKYYLGLNICRRDILKKISTTTNSCGLFAEIDIHLIKNGYTYKEIPMQMHKKDMSINIFRPNNFFGVLKTVLMLFIDYRILNKKGKGL